MRKTIYKTILATCTFLLCGCASQPKQSSIVENTTTPEPEKETIEINIDNWQNYIETREEVEVQYNAFDEPEDMAKVLNLYLKDGYEINENCTIDVAIEYSFTQEEHYVTYDFTNQTITIEDITPYAYALNEKQIQSLDSYTIKESESHNICIGSFWIAGGGSYTYDENGNRIPSDTSPVSTNIQVTRIQGTMEVLKQA